jgi:hypothetical protein
MSGPCIATVEFMTYGHSTLGRGSQLLWLSRLHRTSHAKRRNRRNSTTKFSLTYSPSLSPEFCANRTKRRNNTPDFSLTTPSIISWRDQMLAVAPDLIFYRRELQPALLRLSAMISQYFIGDRIHHRLVGLESPKRTVARKLGEG